VSRSGICTCASIRRAPARARSKSNCGTFFGAHTSCCSPRVARGFCQTQSILPRAACGCYRMAGIQGTCKGRASGETRCGLAAAGRAPPRPRAMRRAQTAAAPPAPPGLPSPRAQATRALRAPARLEKRKGGEREQEWRELESLNLTLNHYSQLHLQTAAASP
jgi:hypothetical protein